MHVQKLFAVICVAAFVAASSVKAQSADTDAQAKAREAIRQKISEMSGQPYQSAPVTTAPPAEPAPTPAPAPVAEPIVVTPAPVAQPAPAPADQTSTPPAASPDTGTLHYGWKLSPEDEQRVIDAMRATKAQLDAQQPTTQPMQTMPALTTTMPAPAMQFPSPMPTTPVYANPTATFNPATSTPAPVVMPDSASPKQQRLAELLELYKADKITPAEYHQERAKIVAAPGP